MIFETRSVAAITRTNVNLFSNPDFYLVLSLSNDLVGAFVLSFFPPKKWLGCNQYILISLTGWLAPSVLRT